MKKHNINNMGFTLVELLAVILIVGIIAAIATYSVSGVSKAVKVSHRKNVISRIEIAAEKYAFDKNENKVFVEELVKNGYLESDDDNDNIFDPVDNSKLNCYAITMASQGSYYKAEFQEEEKYETETGACDYDRLSELNVSLKMSAAQEVNGEMVEINRGNWIKGDFSIFVHMNNNQKINCSNTVQTVNSSPNCSIASTNGEIKLPITSLVSSGKVRVDVPAGNTNFEREGTYTFTYNRMANNMSKVLTESITLKLDNKAPEVSCQTSWHDGYYIYVTVSENGSGINSYCFNDSVDSVSNCEWVDVNNKVFNFSKPRGTEINKNYYVHVKDNVGNIGVSNPESPIVFIPV